MTEPPLWASYCHCTRCQRRTGSAASASARIADGSLRIHAGEGLIREYQPPDEGAAKVFCSACGGSLWSPTQGDPPVIRVRMETFDADPGVRPSDRQYVAYAAPWEPIPDDELPRFDQARPADELSDQSAFRPVGWQALRAAGPPPPPFR